MMKFTPCTPLNLGIFGAHLSTAPMRSEIFFVQGNGKRMAQAWLKLLVDDDGGGFLTAHPIGLQSKNKEKTWANIFTKGLLSTFMI